MRKVLLSASRRHFDFGIHFLSARCLVPASWDRIWSCCLVARAEVCQAGQHLCWCSDPLGTWMSLNYSVPSPASWSTHSCSSHLHGHNIPDREMLKLYLDFRIAAFAIWPTSTISHAFKSTSGQMPSASASVLPEKSRMQDEQREARTFLHHSHWSHNTAEQTLRPEKCSCIPPLSHRGLRKCHSPVFPCLCLFKGSPSPLQNPRSPSGNFYLFRAKDYFWCTAPQHSHYH